MERGFINYYSIIQGIDFLLDHSVDSDLVSISFYGGEPVLEFEMIKEAVKYADQQFAGKKHNYSMTTNATLLNEENIKYFSEHKFNLMFSMDGPKEIHDKNRVYANTGKGTFDVVQENLRYICREYPDLLKGFSINMVVDPCNDYDVLNNTTLIAPMLKDRASFYSNIMDRSYDDEDTVFSNSFQVKDNYNQFLSFLYYCDRVKKENVSFMALSEIKRLEIDFQKHLISGGLGEIAAPGGPCIPGQLRLLVNVNGDFFPCERVSELSSAMKIGSLADGFDIEQCKRHLNIGALTEDECKNCWAINLCTACARLADNGNCLSGTKKLKNCEWIREAAENKLRKYILLRELEYTYRPCMKWRDEV